MADNLQPGPQAFPKNRKSRRNVAGTRRNARRSDKANTNRRRRQPTESSQPVLNATLLPATRSVTRSSNLNCFDIKIPKSMRAAKCDEIIVIFIIRFFFCGSLRYLRSVWWDGKGYGFEERSFRKVTVAFLRVFRGRNSRICRERF